MYQKIIRGQLKKKKNWKTTSEKSQEGLVTIKLGNEIEA